MIKNNNLAMRKAVLNGFVVVILVSLVICGLVFSGFISEYMVRETEQSMVYSIKLIDRILDYDGDLQEQALELNHIVLDEKSRITIMDVQGNILADTNKSVDFDENHLERVEVQEALNSRIGMSIRYSSTMRQETMYTAIVGNTGEHVVRLALPYGGNIALFRAIVPSFFISIVVAFIIAILLAKRMSRNVTEPLKEITGELQKIQNDGEILNLQEYKYDEINDIARAIRTMSDRIDRTVERVKYEKGKTDYILDNMSEGLILLDERREVITINKAAVAYLKCDKRNNGGNIVHYTQNMSIIDGVSEVIESGIESAFDITTIDSRIVAVHISKIKKGVLDKSVGGAIVLMIDVTTERETEEMRQEFFSNASHELKTPITSIQGYSELLVSGMDYSEEQKKEFLTRIRDESQSMTTLINDILTISRLETGTKTDNPIEINVKDLVGEIIKTIEPMWTENNVAIQMLCDDVRIWADYSKIHQLLNNLIVNAVKYNKQNGSVKIEVKWQSTNLYILVCDTGIGIPSESQSRVFERFYRVDKGRCKKEGGTGLGLAIVKHIVNYYKGNIKLKSQVDKGTEIEIVLPIQNRVQQ